VDVKQEGNEQWVEVAFDQDQLQGVVNGGHTYGTLLHVVHDHPVYAEGMTLKVVLAKKDKAAENPNLAPLLENDEKLADRIARARERAMVQLELVAPISDPELLHDIARARNLSQSVDQTALQNLAGKYELMKRVLADAPPPLGPLFIERVVWKTNQEVPEGSTEVPVKTLIHLLALMNIRLYKPTVKAANEVYMRSGVIVREFGEADGEDSAFYDKLAYLLPDFIRLYDHIYSALPETQPSFPWADGKPPVRDETSDANYCKPSEATGGFVPMRRGSSPCHGGSNTLQICSEKRHVPTVIGTGETTRRMGVYRFFESRGPASKFQFCGGKAAVAPFRHWRRLTATPCSKLRCVRQQRQHPS
jgi:AIPR protein